MNEIWKDVIGFEGLYQVSNLGRVKSLDRKVNSRYGINRIISGKILKKLINTKGYLYVDLKRKCKGKKHLIHRLVAQAFIPNPENKPQVNHIDGNKQNNCVSNLEWNTISENQQHAFANHLNHPNNVGKFGKKHPKSIKILMFDNAMNYIKCFDSIADAERTLKINSSHISKCCRKKLKTAGGFIWRYMNDYYK